MTSPWVVTTSTDRVNLNAQRQGELMFTVTNSSDAADQVVFTPVGEGVDSSALAVDNPGRQVPGHGSASFLVRIAIPQQVAAGRYELHGEAYSAHLAPEDTLARSGRVVFEVAPPPEPKRRPWWLLAVVGLVVIVLGVVAWLVFANRGPAPVPPKPSPSASPSASPARTATAVPNLVGLPQATATDALTGAGLKLGKVRLHFDAANNGRVIQQATPAGAALPLGTAVDVVVAVAPAPATPLRPLPGGSLPGASQVGFQWAGVPGAVAYRLVVNRSSCRTNIFSSDVCGPGPIYGPVDDQVFNQAVPGTTTVVSFGAPPVPPLVPTATIIQTVTWQVTPIDEFGSAGTPGSTVQFTMKS
jgi:hypothetical protein